jgi:hypothetical protein
MYVLEPGQTSQVEAMPDAVGLKIGVVYQVKEATLELLYTRFFSKNESTFNINVVSENGEISYFGGEQ